MRKEVLKDLLDFNQKLVICGTAAGENSATSGYYYANSNNQFWNMLYEVRLTPFKLDPSQYYLLKDYSIGLSDIAKDQQGIDSNIEFSQSQADSLLEKILYYRPKILCFNGKKAAKIFLNKAYVDYGLSDKKIGDTTLFIAPSTSGSGRRYWDIKFWHEVASMANTTQYRFG